MNCSKTLELIKESQELHAQALVQIQQFAETFSDMRPKGDLNIFTELRKINTEYESLKKQISENLKQVENILSLIEIDTGAQYKLPDWAESVAQDEEGKQLHDTSLGIIEWDKEKYKDSLYFFGSIKAKDIIAKIKSEKIPVLNVNVLDYLLENQEQIPEEWKKDEKGKIRHIHFFGTIFCRTGGLHYVPCLYWHDNKWKTHDSWLQLDWKDSYPAVILAK